MQTVDTEKCELLYLLKQKAVTQTVFSAFIYLGKFLNEKSEKPYKYAQK